MQRLIITLVYVLHAGTSLFELSFLCFLVGLIYLVLAWADAKWTVYVLSPGQLRAHLAGLDELKFREEIHLRPEDVIDISRKTHFLSALFKLRFYDIHLKTRSGEVRLRGLPESPALEAWLKSCSDSSRSRKENFRRLEKRAEKHTRPELMSLRNAVEQGSARKVEISARCASASLAAEFLNPKAEVLDVIEDAYLLAEKVSQRLGAGGKPALRVESDESRIRTNRIERLL